MQIPRASYQNANGIVDKVIGLVREVAGELLNKKSWIEAGEAQQTKGSEKLKALRAQVEADAHAAKAKAASGRQRSTQESKAS